MTLRRRARAVSPDADVVQRIKRLRSIEAKIRKQGYRLSQIQDIGGCRAVLPSVAAVDSLAMLYLKSRWDHELAGAPDDYLRHPATTGYRSFHMVYRYRGAKREYENLKIELQMRTRLQHAWATAVETVDMFTAQALKSGAGDPEWLRFFALMGSTIAISEELPLVPGTPDDEDELRKELRALSTKLNAVARLRAFGNTIEFTSEQAMGEFFLMDQDVHNDRLIITSYPRGLSELALSEYEKLEVKARDDPRRDVVLVSAENTAALRRSYPNYFADTTMFVELVQEAIR